MRAWLVWRSGVRARRLEALGHSRPVEQDTERSVDRQRVLGPDHDLQARAIRVDDVPVRRVVEVLVEQRLAEAPDDPRQVRDDRLVAGVGRHQADVDVRERVGATRRVRPDEEHREDALVRPTDVDNAVEPRLDVVGWPSAPPVYMRGSMWTFGPRSPRIEPSRTLGHRQTDGLADQRCRIHPAIRVVLDRRDEARASRRGSRPR